MPEHRFSYPRVLPVPPKGPPPETDGRRQTRSQRDLVAASLVRCPPRPAAAGRPEKR